LESNGIATRISELDPANGFRAEIATAFDLHHVVRTTVLSVTKDEHLPIVVAGNSNTGVVGCLAAHNADNVGLFWFDAHSDAETPETSTSGFFDGMGFALALGECWKPKLNELHWNGLNGARSSLVAAREISPGARELLHRRGVAIVSPAKARSASATDALANALSQMRSAGVTRVHIHIDLDVLDPDLVGPANSYALPDGLTVEQLLEHVRTILAEFSLASASVGSYDPSVDISGAVAAAGIEAITLLASSHLSTAACERTADIQ